MATFNLEKFKTDKQKQKKKLFKYIISEHMLFYSKSKTAKTLCIKR